MVIPRNRWLRLNMTEKLFTGTLNKNQNKTRSYHLHTVCFWPGHSLCRAPLTTEVDIYPRVLPSAYCVLLAGPLPLQAPLTTGVDIYPRVLPSACCVLLAGPLPLQGALNHWGRYLPQGPTICILCASGRATPFAGRP